MKICVNYGQWISNFEEKCLRGSSKYGENNIVEASNLKNDMNSFRRRICMILNILIPGLGIFIYDRRIVDSLISLLLYAFLIWFFLTAYTEAYARVLYSIPALTTLIISTASIGYKN